MYMYKIYAFLGIALALIAPLSNSEDNTDKLNGDAGYFMIDKGQKRNCAELF